VFCPPVGDWKPATGILVAPTTLRGGTESVIIPGNSKAVTTAAPITILLPRAEIFTAPLHLQPKRPSIRLPGQYRSGDRRFYPAIQCQARPQEALAARLPRSGDTPSPPRPAW